MSLATEASVSVSASVSNTNISKATAAKATMAKTTTEALIVRRLTHVLLEAPVEATLVIRAAVTVAGAVGGRREAPDGRAHGAHGRAAAWLHHDVLRGGLVALLAAVHLVLGRPAPVGAGGGRRLKLLEGGGHAGRQHHHQQLQGDHLRRIAESASHVEHMQGYHFREGG